MIRRLSCVVFWLLLLLAIMVSSGSAADCRDPFCSIKLWSATLELDTKGNVTGGVPATFAYNNLWNTRGARGFQTLTTGTAPLWSTTWDWKRGQGYTVTSYVSTVSGWHWGEINEGPPPERFETEDLIPAPLSTVGAITTTASYAYVADSACDPTAKRPIICRYDVAYDLWFHGEDPTGLGLAPKFELMVWLDYSWHDLWIGYTPIATFNDDATRTTWKVFSTASTNAVFVPDWDPNTMPKGNSVNGKTLNLREFIDKAKNEGWIDAGWWLSSVEFGIEVYQGKGTFTVDNYTLHIE